MAISKKLRFEILKRDNFRCRYCGRQGTATELHVDHVHESWVIDRLDSGEEVRENDWLADAFPDGLPEGYM